MSQTTLTDARAMSGTYTGGNAIIDDFLAQMLAPLDLEAPVSRELRTLTGDRDVAVAEWTAHATTRAGEPYHNDYCAVFETTDGLITAVREYFDTDRMGTVMFRQS